MKRIILLSIISGVLFGQQSKPKHYRSAGFLDHKTGMSLVSYARTLKYHNKSEYFVGIGTLIAANTFALGWKYSFWQSFRRIFSVQVKELSWASCEP